MTQGHKKIPTSNRPAIGGATPPAGGSPGDRAAIESLRQKLSELASKKTEKAATILTEWMRSNGRSPATSKKSRKNAPKTE